MADLITRLKLANSEFNSSIDSSKQKVKQFQDSADDASKSLKEMGDKGEKSASELLDGMSKFENGARSVTNYKAQLAQLQKQITDLTVNYRSMSQEMQQSAQGLEIKSLIEEATQQAAVYKDAIMDVQQEIRTLASDTAAWDAMKMGIDTASSALQGFVSMGILGEQSTEKLVAVIAKLKSIEAATNAVIKIGNALQKNSALMAGIAAVQSKALAKAKQLEAVATGQATVAQKLFNKVAMLNPYVALAAAILAVGTALAAFVIHSDKAKKAQEELTEAHETYMEKMKDSISKMGEAAYTFDTLEKKYKACRTEAEKQQFLKDYKSKLDDLGLSITDLNSLEDVFIRRTEAFRQACILRAQAMGLETMQAESYKEMMSELMAARDLAAGRGDQRINEGDPLFDMLKKYDVGQYVARLGKDYIVAPANVEKQLENAIRAAAKKASKAIDDEHKNLEEQVEALDLGNLFNFDGKGNSGTPETKNSPANKAKEVAKELVNQIDILKKQKQELEEQKKYIEYGTDAWWNQLKAINDIDNKIKDLEDNVKAFIKRLNSAPLEKLEMPKNSPTGKATYEATLKVRPVISRDDQASLYAAAQETVAKIENWLDLGLIGKEDAKAFVNNINETLSKNGIKAKVGIEFNAKDVEKAVKSLDDLNGFGSGIIGSFNDVYEAISSLNDKLEDAENGWESFFAVFSVGQTILSSAATVIETVATIMDLLNLKKTESVAATTADTAATKADTQAHLENAGAKAAEAIAGATKSASEIPYIGWILAGVTAVSLLATLLSSMKTAKGFASGGIVPGNALHGDTQLIRANSGELILNNQQQAKLFKMLNGQERLSSSSPSGEVIFKIHGSDLIGTLNNYNSRRAKI